MPGKPIPIEKTIAWNKAVVKIPNDWEVDSLSEDHILIGLDSKPRLEIKWSESPKRFTLERFIKKFVKQAQRELDIQIFEQPSQSDFSDSHHHFNFFFFTWNATAAKGIGVLVFCNNCKRLTLFRFFNTNHFDAVSKTILHSFGDHSVDGKTHWAVFGLKVDAPDSFKIKDFSFKPGFFTLHLKDKKDSLIFYNWGPASFLLSQEDLTAFALNRLNELKGLAQTGVCERGSYLEWTFKKEKFKNAVLVPVFKNLLDFVIFRICHDTQKNRIIGLWFQSPTAYNHDLIRGSILGDI